MPGTPELALFFPLSFVWTPLIYAQTGEQVDPAQQRQAGTGLFIWGLQSMKNVFKLSPNHRNDSNLWYYVGCWGGGGSVLNLSKS